MTEQEAKAMLEALGYVVQKPVAQDVFLLREPGMKGSPPRYSARTIPHARKSGCYYRAGTQIARIPMDSLEWKPFTNCNGGPF